MLPQAGKEQGTTSCWITQLRGQENYITRQILYVCTMGSSSRDRKERGDAKAGETLADFHLCLALPHSPGDPGSICAWKSLWPWETIRGHTMWQNSYIQCVRVTDLD